jgi:hypothetical protein
MDGGGDDALAYPPSLSPRARSSKVLTPMNVNHMCTANDIHVDVENGRLNGSL